MADEEVVLQYLGRECGVIGSACCDGSSAGHAGVDIQVYQVPVILVDEEHAVGGGKETVEPGQILAELRG